MGKQGPCCHCGITSTPLWRNGPPEKPVLCNACGSRWRTKGTLANYTPLHCRELGPADLVDCKNSRLDKSSLGTKPQSSCTSNEDESNTEAGATDPEDDQFPKGFEDATSNRSSAGSGISYSESCVRLGHTDVNDISGSTQSHVWDSHVPSRKRTGIKRHCASVEKLRNDLYDILHEQDLSYLSESSEVLIFEREGPIDSVETGLGSVLIKLPATATTDEESVASSLSIENKLSSANEAYSDSSFFHVQSQSCEINSAQVGNDRVVRVLARKEKSKELHAK